MQSEPRHIQNLLNGVFLCQLDTQKHSILDVWRGSDEYASAEKQGKFKVSKKNSQCRYVKCKWMWYTFRNISMILANVLWISSV